MLIRKLAGCSMVLALAACDTLFGSDPEVPGVSSLSFQHDGVGGQAAGTYSAMGDLPGGGLPELGDWVFAHLKGAGTQSVEISASRTAGSGRYDLVTVLLPPGARSGQRVTFLEMCETVPSCGSFFVIVGWNPDTSRSANLCWLAGGEMRIRRLTSERVAGTFSGSVRCANPPVGPAQVLDGKFDVAIVQLPAG